MEGRFRINYPHRGNDKLINTFHCWQMIAFDWRIRMFSVYCNIFVLFSMHTGQNKGSMFLAHFQAAQRDTWVSPFRPKKGHSNDFPFDIFHWHFKPRIPRKRITYPKKYSSAIWDSQLAKRGDFPQVRKRPYSGSIMQIRTSFLRSGWH